MLTDTYNSLVRSETEIESVVEAPAPEPAKAAPASRVCGKR